mgnify:CR=1 FL=1
MAVGKRVTGSTAQRQREYRQRLKVSNPELLRQRERRKWHRRQMKRRVATQSSPLQNNVEAPYNRTSPLLVEMKHREMFFHAGNSGDTDNICTRRMHLVDETTYRNYFQHVDAAETHENHPMMNQDVSSRLRNSELEEIVKCFLLGLLNKWMKVKNSETSHVSCEPATVVPESARNISSERTETTRSRACEKGVMKASTMKTNKITKTNAKHREIEGMSPYRGIL